MKRDLVSIGDLSDAEIVSLLDHAGECEQRGGSKTLEGAILATLFLEPSTRTRLSFEAAMHRLGGAVITSADPQASSSAKGETLADTVRMVDAYADAIVLRHSAAGAARAAARVARAPVLNAGDGGHEHPSQTLVDLFTLKREVGRLNDLRILLYGDLRYGRTAHSLVRALCRFGGTVLAVSEPGLELPEYVLAGLGPGASAEPARPEALRTLFRGEPPSATLIRPRSRDSGPPRRWEPGPGEIDAVYVTRLQRERIGAERAAPVLPPVDPRFLAIPALERAIVMHPLPRTSEIDPRIDADRRAAYFRQAAAGVPVRMAILSWALGRLELAGPRRPDATAQEPASSAAGSCSERTCISVRESSTAPAERVRGADGSARCAWCETPWPAGQAPA
jgi:aspartate carbamoyltransferase catalytic subunit